MNLTNMQEVEGKQRHKRRGSDRHKKETDEKQIKNSHPLTERWENECCVFSLHWSFREECVNDICDWNI